MHKLKSLIVAVLLLFVGGQMMGQTHGTMLLGASFPMSDYAKVNGINSTALFGDVNQVCGGAAVGFNVGLKWDFSVGVQGLAVILSMDGFFNGPNSDMDECYDDKRNELDVLYNDIDLTTPRYINASGMLGLRYIYYFNPQFGMYIEAGAGGCGRYITDYCERYNFTDILTEDTKRHKNTMEFSSAYTFAYQAGAGIEVSKKLVLACSFYDLGAAPVKGEYIEKINWESTTTNFKHGNLHPMMVLARIGFRF